MTLVKVIQESDVTVKVITGDTVGASPSGIAYNFPFFDGQEDTYADGDSGWHYQNGTYNYTPPPYPVSYARLDFSVAGTFGKLVSNNAFGNKDRYTDTTGSQTYANGFLIDHFTGIMWRLNIYGTDNWVTSVQTNTHGALIDGYNDWRVANIEELQTIINRTTDNAKPFRDEPWATQLPLLDSVSLWTSSTRQQTTTNAYYIDCNNQGRILWGAKTLSLNYLICRNFYV